MVLCVSAVDAALGTLELSDGWYSAWAACDEPLRAQLARGRVRVGAKLRVCCTEWKGDSDPDTPLWRAAGPQELARHSARVMAAREMRLSSPVGS